MLRHLQSPPLVHPHPFVSVHSTGQPAHPYLRNVDLTLEMLRRPSDVAAPTLWDACWRWGEDTQLLF